MPGIEPRFLGRSANSLVAIPAESLRLYWPVVIKCQSRELLLCDTSLLLPELSKHVEDLKEVKSTALENCIHEVKKSSQVTIHINSEKSNLFKTFSVSMIRK
jgi:hypothetical protein